MREGIFIVTIPGKFKGFLYRIGAFFALVLRAMLAAMAFR